MLASGQAFAIDGSCTSVAGGGAWNAINTWESGGAIHVIGCDDGFDRTVPDVNDDVFIPSSTAVTLDADSIAKSVTISGGKFTSGSNTLTISGSFTNNAAAAADVNLASGKVAFVAAAIVGGTAATTFNHLSIAGGALIIPTTSIVGGNFMFETGGTLAGLSVLTLAPTGNHTIAALAGGSAIPSLNLSGATVNKIISLAPVGNLTLNAVTFPTAASKQITFTAGPAVTISVPVPAATVATCVNDGVAVAASTTATVAATKSMVCTSGAGGGGGTVSAPIFDLKPAQIFATEVKP